MEVQLVDAGGAPAASTIDAIGIRLATHDPAFAPFDVDAPGMDVEQALHDATTFARILSAWEPIATLGVSLATAHTMATFEPSREVAATARRVARSLHRSDASWHEAVRPVRDGIRRRQQSALYAALTELDRKVRSEADFHARYFVDSQMDPCMDSSRLKLAISSVQTYVNRCLLGLVKDVSLDSEDEVEWRGWRQSYRVWEAARKVALFPENWLLADLRLHCSPEFDTFSAKLESQSLDDRAAEEALAAYLVEILPFANPQLACITQDPESQDLHVFARAGGQPSLLLHRVGKSLGDGVGVDADAGDRWFWEPWEKLPFPVPEPAMNGATEDVEPKDDDGHEDDRVRSNPASLDRMAAFAKGDTITLLWTTATILQTDDGENDPRQYKSEVRVHFAVQSRSGWSAPQEAARIDRPNDRIVNVHLRMYDIGGTDPLDDPTPKQIPSGLYATVEIKWRRYYHSNRRRALEEERDTIEQVLDELGTSHDADNFDDLSSFLRPAAEVLQGRHQEIVSQIDNEGEARTDAYGGFAYLWSPTLQGFVEQKAASESLESTAHRDLKWLEQHYVAEWDGLLGVRDKLTSERQSLRVSVAGGSTAAFGGITYFINSIDRTPVTVLYSREQGGRAGVLIPANFTSWGGQTPFAVVASDRSYLLTVTDVEFRSNANTNRFMSGGPTIPGTLGSTGSLGTILSNEVESAEFDATPFHHSYLPNLLTVWDQAGPDGLFGIAPGFEDLARQKIKSRKRWNGVRHTNTRLVSLRPDIEDGTPGTSGDVIPFSWYSPGRMYSWELLLHAPMIIAQRLRDNGDYANALRWLGRILDVSELRRPFDDANSDDIDKSAAWRIRPLWNPEHYTDHDVQAYFFQRNPFDVHALAEQEPVAYRLAVVRQFVETLLDWADHLFSQDSIESIAEATQLYLYAASVLGPRPVDRPSSQGEGAAMTFEDVREATRGEDDTLLNPQVALENLLRQSDANVPAIRLEVDAASPPEVGLFCEPRNEGFLVLWDKVDDRLFKIRHCLNIDGVFRRLPLFEPPIDPGALIAAVAHGASLSDLEPTRWVSPHLRFATMLAMARSVAQRAQQLSDSLQRALQARDAEELSLLRQGQETMVLELTDAVRVGQLQQSELDLATIEASRAVAEARHAHYERLLDEGELKGEQDERRLQNESWKRQLSASRVMSAAAVLSYLPRIHLQAVSSGTSTGGAELASALSQTSSALSQIAATESARAGLSRLDAARRRRTQEWAFQRDVAKRDLDHLDARLAAAGHRVELASRELATHRKQVEHARQLGTMLASRFTNEDLHDWMASELQRLSSRTFDLALELARKAEVCLRRELGARDSAFVSHGHWNSNRKGLLAAQQLFSELDAMEVAFSETDRREFEITKHVSLRRLDPAALLTLHRTGACEFFIDEVLFDLDFPGQYFRRIKAVTVSIPAVTGPYDSVNGLLTLVRSEVREDPKPGEYSTDGRIAERWVERIALSGGRNDAGMFTFDFRDARYLPYEHRGVISTWNLELSGAGDPPRPAFDWTSIADVVLHVRYTARYDIDLVAKAQTSVAAALDQRRAEGGATQVALSFRESSPEVWQAFQMVEQGASGTLSIALDWSHIPYLLQALDPTVAAATVVLVPHDERPVEARVDLGLNADGTPGGTAEEVAADPALGGLPARPFVLPHSDSGPPGPLPSPGDRPVLTVRIEGLADARRLRDVVVLLDLVFE